MAMTAGAKGLPRHHGGQDAGYGDHRQWAVPDDGRCGGERKNSERQCHQRYRQFGDWCAAGRCLLGTPENDTISGLSAGNNFIDGLGGLNTVKFTETLTSSEFSYNNTIGAWVVTTASEGTDYLQGIEVVSDGSGPGFLLVGAGSSYATPDQAFSSAQTSSGDIIIDTLAQDGVPTLSFNEAFAGAANWGRFPTRLAISMTMRAALRRSPTSTARKCKLRSRAMGRSASVSRRSPTGRSQRLSRLAIRAETAKRCPAVIP